MQPQNIHQRSQNLRHLDPGMGLNLGVFGFSSNQNNLWFVRCVSYLHVPRSEREDKQAQNAVRSTKILKVLFCVYFCLCSLQKLKDSQIEPHGWWYHYTGWYRRSGISGVYLWMQQSYYARVGILPLRMFSLQESMLPCQISYRLELPSHEQECQ